MSFNPPAHSASDQQYAQQRPALIPSSSSSTSGSSSSEILTPLQTLSLHEGTGDNGKVRPTNEEDRALIRQDSDTEQNEMRRWLQDEKEKQGFVASHARSTSKSKTHAKLPSAARPELPPRQISFSKRHASFDTPREVPLPSPRSPFQQNQYSSFPFPTTNTSSHASHSRNNSSNEPGLGAPASAAPLCQDGPSAGGVTVGVTTTRQPPGSTPIGSSSKNSNPYDGRDDFPFLDRHSVAGPSSSRVNAAVHAASSGSVAVPSSSSSSSASSSYSSLLSAPSLSDPSNARVSPASSRTSRPSVSRPGSGDVDMVDDPSQGPVRGSAKGKERERHAVLFQSPPSLQQPPSPTKQLPKNLSTPSSTPVTPFSRPYSTPEAPESYIPGKIYSPQPLKPWDRSSTASLPLPQQQPYSTLPTLAAASERDEDSHHGREGVAGPSRTQSPPMFDAASRSPSPSHRRIPTPPLLRSSTSAMNRQSPLPDAPRTVSAAGGMPPPAPPTILTPPPPPLSPEAQNNTARRPAPYEPFLSHAPPPEDSWIAVETTQREYRLIVRLPGFRRDGITLATRRRRILHVVADSWELGGGHFERRISFGYDADLAHVRAEFDGEMLKIGVPRRPPHAGWYGPQQRD